jgi:hypothetical protein
MEDHAARQLRAEPVSWDTASAVKEFSASRVLRRHSARTLFRRSSMKNLPGLALLALLALLAVPVGSTPAQANECEGCQEHNIVVSSFVDDLWKLGDWEQVANL